MLKCISMQNLINLYLAVQDLGAILLKDLDWPKCCLVIPRHRFAYQRLDNVKMNMMNKYAKFVSMYTMWFKSYDQFH